VYVCGTGPRTADTINASSADTANARPSGRRPVVALNGGANKAINVNRIIHTGTTTVRANNTDMAVTFILSTTVRSSLVTVHPHEVLCIAVKTERRSIVASSVPHSLDVHRPGAV
jgi:hypothetical protein